MPKRINGDASIAAEPDLADAVDGRRYAYHHFAPELIIRRSTMCARVITNVLVAFSG